MESVGVYLFGDRSSLIFKMIFLLFTFLGSVITATNILDFSDLMILGMAFLNILGLILLSGGVKKDLDHYIKSLHQSYFQISNNLPKICILSVYSVSL